MTASSRQVVAAVLLAAASATHAQTPFGSQNSPAPATPAKRPSAPAIPYLNHNLVFLDPAHGGPDSGAHLNGNLLEKDITLSLANRIRALLVGSNLSVLLAREADAPAPSADATDDQPPAPATIQSPDARAGAANHTHPVACVLLHATSSGNGVHIVISPLAPPDPSTDLPAPTARAVPWESAQTDSIPQSVRLANEIGTAIARANLPVHLSRASVKPIDSLTCPAVAIEVAPLMAGPTPVSDPAYQQRVAQAVATALLFWRGHADPPVSPRTDLPPTNSATPRTRGAQP